VKLEVMAAQCLLHLMTIGNSVAIAQLFTMTIVTMYSTVPSVPGLGLRMTQANGILQLQLVDVSHQIKIRTRSPTRLIMNLEIIAQLCKTKIATLLTVSNANGPGPSSTQ